MEPGFVRRSLPRMCAGALVMSGTIFGAAIFQSGTVYDGQNNGNLTLFDVTGGGAIASPFLDRNPGDAFGQIGFSQDLHTAYLTVLSTNEILALDASAHLTAFATGILNPSGLVVTNSGHILVASFNDGTVYDITNGGDFSSVTPFAMGLNSPRDLLQVSAGVILVADSSTGDIFNIAGGGDFSAATPFATGLGPIAALAEFNGHLYAATYGGSKVFDVTAGGDFSSAAAFASGLSFAGLTVDGANRLLANDASGTGIYDISKGGDFSAASPFATIAGGQQDALFGTVPAVSQTPEPVTLPFSGGVLAGIWFTRRRTMRPS